MTINDVLALSKAGFTKTEIMQLGTAAQPQTAPAQQIAGGVFGQPAAYPAAHTQPQTGIQQPNAFDMLCNAVAGQMQNQNIMAMQMPKEETTEDILASLVAAPTQEGGAQ